MLATPSYFESAFEPGVTQVNILGGRSPMKWYMNMETINNILVPTDFSELSLDSIKWVTSVPMIDDARICLLHVLDRTLTAPSFPPVDLSVETVLRDVLEQADEELNDFMISNMNNDSRFVMIVRRGEASKRIVKFVHEEEIDLINMATQNRKGLAYMLTGVLPKVLRGIQVFPY